MLLLPITRQIRAQSRANGREKGKDSTSWFAFETQIWYLTADNRFENGKLPLIRAPTPHSLRCCVEFNWITSCSEVSWNLRWICAVSENWEAWKLTHYSFTPWHHNVQMFVQFILKNCSRQRLWQVPLVCTKSLKLNKTNGLALSGVYFLFIYQMFTPKQPHLMDPALVELRWGISETWSGS